MVDITQAASRHEHPDDIAIWPDGTWAHIGDVRKGEYHYMSDDYEVVPIEDIARLSELGFADELFA